MVTVPVGRGGLADQLGEACAERAERRTADGQAHLGDGQVAAAQQRLRPLDAPRHQVGVRRLAVRVAELPGKVRGGHQRGPGEHGDVERARVLAVHQVAGPAQPREVRELLWRHSASVTAERPVAAGCGRAAVVAVAQVVRLGAGGRRRWWLSGSGWVGRRGIASAADVGDEADRVPDGCIAEPVGLGQPGQPRHGLDERVFQPGEVLMGGAVLGCDDRRLRMIPGHHVVAPFTAPRRVAEEQPEVVVPVGGPRPGRGRHLGAEPVGEQSHHGVDEAEPAGSRARAAPGARRPNGR